VSSDPRPAPRSQEQAREALASGNRVRTLRAELWRDWKAKGRTEACLDAAGLIAEPPRYMMTWAVEDVLGRLPTIGRLRLHRTDRSRSGSKIKVWLRELGISMGTTVGQLTFRQRSALCERLRLYADPREWTAHLERLRRP
jgi:hypothetical protein